MYKGVMQRRSIPMQRGFIYVQEATQRYYPYAKRACLYTRGQRRDAIPMQRGFIYVQGGNAEMLSLDQ
jgi:hypothetical protein